MKCQHCGSENIETGISWGQNAETGNVGPRYKVNLLMIGVAATYCDLCLDCGEIVRLYVKDPKKNWYKK